jgi:voltage-gated potassium channel
MSRKPAARRRGGIREWLFAAGFTVVMVGLIAGAVADIVSYLAIAVLVAIVAGAGCFFLLFPGSTFLAVSFANALSVYACVFVFLVESNFRIDSTWEVPTAFVLPIAAFLAGAFWRRREIRRIVALEHERGEVRFRHVVQWMMPVAAIAVLTFLVPARGYERVGQTAILLGMMSAVSVIVFLMSRDVCAFLVSTGTLFEALFKRLGDLVIPAYAFFTLYSIVVIFYACIYRIVDVVSAEPHFAIRGVVRDISFPEGLYFSLVTLSTVGYGDIVPLSNPIRVLIGSEIVVGILLLLFGVSEIMAQVRERREGPRG